MITVKNIDYIIKNLNLIRNSTRLMELINSSNISKALNNIIGTSLDIKDKNNLSEAKLYALLNILNTENINNILNDENINTLAQDMAINFILDKLYYILKEYAEKVFEEAE